MYTKVYVNRSDDQSKNKSIIHVCVKEVSWVKEVYYTVRKLGLATGDKQENKRQASDVNPVK